MSDQRDLLVGLDLSDDFTQISCFNTKYFEPESIGVSDEEQFLIPTVLCVKLESKDWTFGEEALQIAKDEKGVLVEHLIELAKQDEAVTVFDINFMASTLLEKFIRKVLSILKKRYAGNSIKKIVVTVETLNDILLRNLYTAFKALGIEKDRLVIKSQACSAMYYVLNQKKELWMNDVGIFDYNGTRLLFYKIAINRRTKPCAVTISCEDLTSGFGKIDNENPEALKELCFIFYRLAKNLLLKNAISTLYVTGKGFEGSWIDATLQDLCVGRRIFKGQNLYTKGACYMARELSGEEKLAEYILLSEDMLHSSIWMTAYVGQKVQDIILAQIGTVWNEVNESVEFIFDGKPEIVLYQKSLFQKETKTYRLPLNNLPSRANKMTRARLNIRCVDKEYIEATLTDLGFGDIYKASDVVSSVLIPIE